MTDFSGAVFVVGRFVVLQKAFDVPPFQRKQVVRALQSGNASLFKDRFSSRDPAGHVAPSMFKRSSIVRLLYQLLSVPIGGRWSKG